jgi:hypothetical protein
MKMFFHYTEIKSKFSSLFLQSGEVFILLHSGFPGFDARKKPVPVLLPGFSVKTEGISSDRVSCRITFEKPYN